MTAKKINLVLSLLLISVLSLSTVFGTPFDDPKPKRLIDTTSSISQPYDTQLGDQYSPPTIYALRYFHIFGPNTAVIAESYRNKLSVIFQQQKNLLLSITPKLKDVIFYRKNKLLSNQQTKTSFI